MNVRLRSLTLTAMITMATIVAGGLGSLAEEQAVAMVNGKAITEADLSLAASEIGESLSRLPPERRRGVAVEYLITRQLFADAAEEAGLGAGEDFEMRLVFAMRRILGELLLQKRVMDKVAEAEIKRFYDEQSTKLRPEEEVRLRHILVASEPVAKEARAKIASGVDFATLAKALSQDTATAWRGGDLGWRVKDHLHDRLAAAAFSLRNRGDLTEPVETEHGWHVVQLEDRRQRPIPEFQAVRDSIRMRLVKEKSEELARSLREKATVVYFDPRLQPEAAPAGTAEAKPNAQRPIGEAPPASAVGAGGTLATAPTTTPAHAAPSVSLWLHKGARMRLAVIGDRVRIEFEAPSEALAKQGIEPGSPIFQGKRAGLSYTGEAFAYSPQCGSRPFPVEGEASADERRLELRGKAPNMDAGCNVTGTRDEVLAFRTVGG
jgi:peptidyl-prolyl cis-trans isomerase C